MNLYEVIHSGFPADGSTCCIEIPGRREYAWTEIESGVAQMVNLLAALGIPPGARVAAQVEKSPEALMLYLAAIRGGQVYVPLNTAYRAAELEYLLRNAEPAAIVCASKDFVWMSSLASEMGAKVVLTMDEDGTGSLLSAAAGQARNCATLACGEDAPAAILYTSGTTGWSKGAVLSHGNLASNARVLLKYWGWRQGDVLLHILPIFHAHGLFVAAQGALLAGAKMIWLPKFEVAATLAALPRSSVLMGVPTHYVRLLAEPGFDRAACRNVRLFVSGSAPLLLETFEQFKVRTGQTILERYGMSETIMLVSNPYDPAQGERIGGTVGFPLPGVSVRVVDEAGRVCGEGETGTVEVRGPNVFKRYWRMAEKTREEFTADGWFKTGDIGRWGGESARGPVPPGYLSLVGRAKDLIISGGFNVYPKEIEGVIDTLPGVAESAVIGLPHPDFGEAVVAIVVPRPGIQLDAADLLLALKERIANFKVPKRIELAAELPRNAMGKVMKTELRVKYGPPISSS